MLSSWAQSATMGIYSLHLTQITIAKLVLQWIHTPPLSSKSSRPKRPPTLITVPKDVRALDVRLRQPLNSKRNSHSAKCELMCVVLCVVEVGGESRIIVALSTGRNVVSKAMLHLSAASGIQFDTETIKIEGEGLSSTIQKSPLC